MSPMWIKSYLQKAPTCDELFSELGSWHWKNHTIHLESSFWGEKVSAHPETVSWLKFYLEHRTGTHVYDFTGGMENQVLGRDAGLMMPLAAYLDVWGLTPEPLPPKIDLYHPKEALKKLKNNPHFIKNPDYFEELTHHYFPHVHDSPIHRMTPYMMPFKRDALDWAKYLNAKESKFPWLFLSLEPFVEVPSIHIQEKSDADKWFLFKPGRIKDPDGRIWKNDDAYLNTTVQYTKSSRY